MVLCHETGCYVEKEKKKELIQFYLDGAEHYYLLVSHKLFPTIELLYDGTSLQAEYNA